MNYARNGIFLLLCFVVGYGIAKAIIRLRAESKGFQSHVTTVETGTGDAPGVRGFEVDGASFSGAGSLEALTKLCTRWNGLHATAVSVTYSPGLSEASLAAEVKTIHAAGLKVVLLPPEKFSGENPYSKGLGDVATDASAANVDALCISWLNADPDAAYWRDAAQAVRRNFKGTVILAATVESLITAGCPDVADVLAVIGPMELPRRLPESSDHFDLHDVRMAWSGQLTSLESLARVNGKKLGLLHMTVPESVSLRLPSEDGKNVRSNPDRALQLLVYEALLTETKGRVTTTEFMFLPWEGTEASGGVRSLTGLSEKIESLWNPKNPSKDVMALGTDVPPAFEDMDNAAATDDAGDVTDK